MTTAAAIRISRSHVLRLSNMSVWLSALIRPQDWPSMQALAGCSPRVSIGKDAAHHNIEAAAKRAALSFPSIVVPFHEMRLNATPFHHEDAPIGYHTSEKKSVPDFHQIRSLGRPLRVFILAGEPSGDIIGGRVMAAMKQMGSVELEFRGVGGSCMQREGLSPVFPLGDLALMGIAEIVFHLPRLWLRLRQAARVVDSWQPDLVLTIDAKGFAFRLLRRIQANSIQKGRLRPLCIHYVAPSFWAWKGGAKSLQGLKGLVDHLLCILPCEPATCRSAGLAASFVGHPALEEMHAGKATGASEELHLKGRGTEFRHRHGLPQVSWPGGGPVICVLPGSRYQERRRMFPIFGEALFQLARDERFRNMSLVLPTLPDPIATRQIEAAVNRWGLPAVVLSMEAGSAMKNDALEVPSISNDEESIHTACSQSRESRKFYFLSCCHQSASSSSASSTSISFSFPNHDSNWKLPLDSVGWGQACDVALCCSGTAVVELMLARVPTVVAYRAHPLTEYVAKRRATVRFASLPNLLLDAPVLPEALFGKCSPQRLAEMLRDLLLNKDKRRAQRAAAVAVMKMLTPPPGSEEQPRRPSEVAADIIFDELQKRSNERHNTNQDTSMPLTHDVRQ